MRHVARTRVAVTLLRESLERGQRVPVRLDGPSLGPLARPGDVLIVERADPGTLRPGELILFEGNEALTAHRIVRTKRKGVQWWFRTAGQAAREPDGWVPAARVVGRVAEIGDGALPDRRRRAPRGWSGRLWAWEAQVRCHIQRLRTRLAPSGSR